MHNALQGGEIALSKIKKEIFEQVIYENSVRNFLDHDFVIVHDPQPLPLIEHYEKKCPWFWRCHLDLSRPDAETWKYLRRWIDNYDVVIPRPGRRRNFPLALCLPGRADRNSDQWRRHRSGKCAANAGSGCVAKIVA
jgi:hypothetical protein